MKRYNKDYVLPLPGLAQFRYLVKGEICVFAAGKRSPSGAFGAAKNAAKFASMLKMKIVQRTMVLTDPVTYKSSPVILVECLEPCTLERKRPGRKAKGDTP